MKPLDIIADFKAFRARQKAGLCPTCGKIPWGPFRDALSLKEYGVSGMCQPCQDIYFAPQEEIDS